MTALGDFDFAAQHYVHGSAVLPLSEQGCTRRNLHDFECLSETNQDVVGKSAEQPDVTQDGRRKLNGCLGVRHAGHFGFKARSGNPESEEVVLAARILLPDVGRWGVGQGATDVARSGHPFGWQWSY